MSLDRRQFLGTFGGIAATAATARPVGAAQSKRQPPNVLLVISDDQGWGDIHSHGNDKIDTPVLDQLAASGARFERFFVSPVCSPTRASLLTGRYHERAGVHGVTRGHETMRSEEVTLAEVFRAAGYRTGCFGKWHNGAHYPYHPNGQGFEEFFGFCGGHWNNYFDTRLEHNGTEVQTKGYISDVLTDAAVAFIEQERKEPFFCYVPYNAPHSPWQVPDKYFDKYKARGLVDSLACTYGMVENLDENIGRLLKRLDDLKLAESTIVLFLTDNGPSTYRYNGGMKGIKGTVHEGGIRAPLFIRWPGRIQAGTRIEPIAAHIDLLPTLVELCGLGRPQTLPLDGVSLVPLLQGESRNWPDRMIFSHWGNRGSVRTQRWRAVNGRTQWALYDMLADPEQKKGVAAQYREVVNDLAAAYEKWFAEVTRAGFDPIPIPIGYPERPEVTMPGHEAYLRPEQGKSISYVAQAGYANDYVTNWTSTDAYPLWEVEVVRPGTYEVTLMYTCPPGDVGARVRVEVGGQQVEAVIESTHDPAPLPSPDRVPRGEVFEKVWAPLTMGKVRLDKGRTQLVVKALSKPGQKVMDLKAVRVKRIE